MLLFQVIFISVFSLFFLKVFSWRIKSIQVKIYIGNWTCLRWRKRSAPSNDFGLAPRKKFSNPKFFFFFFSLTLAPSLSFFFIIFYFAEAAILICQSRSIPRRGPPEPPSGLSIFGHDPQVFFGMVLSHWFSTNFLVFFFGGGGAPPFFPHCPLRSLCEGSPPGRSFSYFFHPPSRSSPHPLRLSHSLPLRSTVSLSFSTPVLIKSILRGKFVSHTLYEYDETEAGRLLSEFIHILYFSPIKDYILIYSIFLYWL